MEYRILWRYGALLLVAVGLLAMGFGAAGARGTTISVTLLSLGFVLLVAGVVLPRIEGKFTAGPSGLSADMLAVYQLDQPSYAVSGPALAIEQHDGVAVAALERADSPAPGHRITLGDVWDALDAAGIRPNGVGLGSAYFTLDDRRYLKTPNRGFADFGVASDELLGVLNYWGVRPTASGKYLAPADVSPAGVQSAWGLVLQRPDDH